MPAYIQHIEPFVPDKWYSQEKIRDFMIGHISGKEITRKLLYRIYARSGIERRHSVIEDFDLEGKKRSFLEEVDGRLVMPGTAHRNRLYSESSKWISPEIARRTLRATPEVTPADITHVITVSCTGFFAPGPDYHIVKDLGLPPETQRYHIGFMGCYAAFPALRMASQFCAANRDANVLVVILELCTLHLKFREETDFLLSGSLFADGGAGILVNSQKPPQGKEAVEILGFETNIAPDSESDMAWTIGDDGFDMALSTYIPRILGTNVETTVAPLLGRFGIRRKDVHHWGIHPGGRAILDKIQQGLALADEQIRPSREVLRRFGNMSSPTVLFVLNEILKQPAKQKEENILAMSFGPGLTLEMMLLKRIMATYEDRHELDAAKKRRGSDRMDGHPGGQPQEIIPDL